MRRYPRISKLLSLILLQDQLRKINKRKEESEETPTPTPT